jgi:hypothetical protein
LAPNWRGKAMKSRFAIGGTHRRATLPGLEEFA